MLRCTILNVAAQWKAGAITSAHEAYTEASYHSRGTALPVTWESLALFRAYVSCSAQSADPSGKLARWLAGCLGQLLQCCGHSPRCAVLAACCQDGDAPVRECWSAGLHRAPVRLFLHGRCAHARLPPQPEIAPDGRAHRVCRRA